MNKKIDLRFWFFVGALILCISLLSRTDIKNVPAWVTEKPTTDNNMNSMLTAYILESQLQKDNDIPTGLTLTRDPLRNPYLIPDIKVDFPKCKFWRFVQFYASDSVKSECMFVLKSGIRITLSYDSKTYTLPFSSYTNENELGRVIPIVWYDEESNCLRDYKGVRITEDTKVTVTIEEIENGFYTKV